MNEVIPIYLGVLFDIDITGERLDRILVEGHASMESNDSDRYLKDLDLSERRAFSVSTHIIKTNIGHYEELKTHMVALGRSFADAKFQGVQNPNSWKDRKVVIKFTLQYEKMMRELIKLKNTDI